MGRSRAVWRLRVRRQMIIPKCIFARAITSLYTHKKAYIYINTHSLIYIYIPANDTGEESSTHDDDKEKSKVCTLARVPREDGQHGEEEYGPPVRVCGGHAPQKRRESEI